MMIIDGRKDPGPAKVLELELQRFCRIASSDRLQAESTLRESERRFNLAINGAGAGLWDWDMLQDRVVYSAQRYGREN